MALQPEGAATAREVQGDRLAGRFTSLFSPKFAPAATHAVVLLLLFGCGEKTAEPAEPAPDAAPSASAIDLSRLHDKVAVIVSNSCSYTRCHGNLVANAGLLFNSTGNFRDGLVDVTACEYDLMARVKPGKPLESWVMIKLTSPVYDEPDRRGLIQFTPDPSWVQKDGPCASTASDGTPMFGMRMPDTAPNMLPDADLESFRRWIEVGAP
jgi:hypothetical protein